MPGPMMYPNQMQATQMMSPNYGMPCFYEFTQMDGKNYYYNPYSMAYQQDKPQSGAMIYPGNVYPYNYPSPFKMMPSMGNSYQSNNLNNSHLPPRNADNKKDGNSGNNLFVFHLPNDWSYFK